MPTSGISRSHDRSPPPFCGCLLRAARWCVGIEDRDFPVPVRDLKRAEVSPTNGRLLYRPTVPEVTDGRAPSPRLVQTRYDSQLVTDAVRGTISNRYSQLPACPEESRTGITSLILRRDPFRDFGFRYEVMGEPCGTGGFSEVFRVRDLYTGEMRAAKRVPKDVISDNALLRRELEMLLTLDHPNVVRLFEWFETPDSIWLIQELCTGGEVLDMVGKCTSREGLRVVRQILLGLSYLHDRKVIHRDIKLENCMFQSREPNSIVKIIDFGLAGISRGMTGGTPELDSNNRGSSRTGKAGTGLYLAPELFSQSRTGRVEYTTKCDMWSLGILTYILLTGEHPFWDKSSGVFDEPDMQRRIHTTPVYVSRIEPDSARDLLVRLLEVDPESRITARQALSHACMRVSAFLGSDLHSRLLSNLRSFRRFRPLERVVLTVLAYQSTDEATAALREVFSLLDTDMNGVLSKVEILTGMNRLGLIIPPDFDAILDSIDADHSGDVDFTEFIAAALSADQVRNSAVTDQCFAWFSQSKIGFVSQSDLEKVVGSEEALYAIGKYGLGGILNRAGFKRLIDDIAAIKQDGISLDTEGGEMDELRRSNSIRRRSSWNSIQRADSSRLSAVGRLLSPTRSPRHKPSDPRPRH